MNPSSRTLLGFLRNPQLRTVRKFSVTSSNFLKEIVHETSADGKTTVISGKYVNSPREGHLLQLEQITNDSPALPPPVPKSSSELSTVLDSKPKEACALCKLKAHGLEVKHTDVLILNQFLDPLGNQLDKATTGLCNKEHKRMKYLITMAKHAGLIRGPLDPKPTRRHGYMKYYKYYDESVIDEFFTTKRKKH